MFIRSRIFFICFNNFVVIIGASELFFPLLIFNIWSQVMVCQRKECLIISFCQRLKFLSAVLFVALVYKCMITVLYIYLWSLFPLNYWHLCLEPCYWSSLCWYQSLAHLSQKLKWAFLITLCPASVCLPIKDLCKLIINFYEQMLRSSCELQCSICDMTIKSFCYN